MRVLMITQYYPPEPVSKFAELGAELRSRGHAVQVITGSPCYPHGSTYDGYAQRFNKTTSHDGVTVLRVPQRPDHSRSVWRRILYYFSFAISAVWYGAFHAGRADIVIAYQSAMPAGFAAWFLSRLKGAKLVLDVVDLWPESVTASGILSNRYASGLIRTAMNWLYGRTDGINVITQGYFNRLRSQGVPASKMRIIPQWPPADVVSRGQESRPDEMTAKGLHIVYAGAIGPCQRLEVLLDAAAALKDDKSPIHFWVLGDGVDKKRLKAEAERRGLARVRFLGQKSAEVASDWLSSADLQLVHLEPSPMANLSIPSKTFAYMANGRPLLAGVAGETNELVRRHRCGVVFEPTRADSLVEAVLQFRSLPQQDKVAMGERAEMVFSRHYSPMSLRSRMANLLEEVVSGMKPIASTPTVRQAA